MSRPGGIPMDSPPKCSPDVACLLPFPHPESSSNVQAWLRLLLIRLQHWLDPPTLWIVWRVSLLTTRVMQYIVVLILTAGCPWWDTDTEKREMAPARQILPGHKDYMHKYAPVTLCAQRKPRHGVGVQGAPPQQFGRPLCGTKVTAVQTTFNSLHLFHSVPQGAFPTHTQGDCSAHYPSHQAWPCQHLWGRR